MKLEAGEGGAEARDPGLAGEAWLREQRALGLHFRLGLAAQVEGGAGEERAQEGREGQGADAAAHPEGNGAVRLELEVDPARAHGRAEVEADAPPAGLHAALGEEDGVVPLLGSGTIAEGAFLVMPLLDGTLSDRLRDGPLPPRRALETARALAAALARIHAHGIVHRDLKPSNVLFTHDGRPLVSDLGLAKIFERLSRQWTVVFEPSSPEVKSDEVVVYAKINGKRKKLD